jgi:hypothetical protein
MNDRDRIERLIRMLEQREARRPLDAFDAKRLLMLRQRLAREQYYGR